ncbi:MAG TPA: ABC transporter permease [Gemmataceae bacterium]|nr:ABC transporter permease [Gemmataceae bacterium]
MKIVLLILKNLRRNKLRTALTCLAVAVLVFVVTMIWTVVAFINHLAREKGGDLKAIVNDRYDMQGQMPLSYAGPLSEGAARKPDDKRPVDSMSWQYYLGTLDVEKRTRENLLVLVATDVRHLPTKVGKDVTHKGMIDDLDPLDKDVVDRLAHTTDGCVIGRKRLKTLNKQVGERFKMYGSLPAGIDLEFEIVGVLPPGRWDDNGFMNERYLNAAIDVFCRDHPERKAQFDKGRIDLFWVEVGKKADFPQVVGQINSSPQFTAPPVKCETFASLVTNFLDSYSGFIWFIEWVLVPGSMFSMVLLIANAISLNVRERTREMAVLKVLGFRPGHLMALVLGEALLLGATSGLAAGGLIYWIANAFFSGITIGASDPFPVPWQALLWGGGVGAGTALIGSVLPAWTASAVRPSQVFARVA